MKDKNIVFEMSGCDISYIASAPEDMTIKELLDKVDEIKLLWCACGISKLTQKEQEEAKVEVAFTREKVQILDANVSGVRYTDEKRNKEEGLD